MSKQIFTRLTLAFILFLTLGAFKSQGQATIKTDLLDYPPGSTAIITGTGFQPGETVTLQVLHVDGDSLGTDSQYHQPFTTIADGSGNISSSWWVPDDGDALGATFKLTANGNLGSNAEWIFTDGINKDPLNLTVCDGNSATFSITTTGSSPSPQWQINTGSGFSNLSNGGIYSGVFTKDLNISSVTSIMNGYQYRCVVAQSGGPFTSAAAILTVNSVPTATAGGSQTICANGTATVSGATSSNGTILWTENGAGSITAGATTLTPTYTAAAGDAGNTVTLTMTVSNAPCTAATASYTIIVKGVPTATAGGSKTICANGTATVSGATSSNGTILWTENGAGSITAGATTLTPTYTATAGDAGNNVTLTMTVSNSPCAAAIATYTITVNSVPTATAGGSQTICANGTATVSGATSSNGTILWTENGAGSITSGATTLTPTYTAAAGDAGNNVTLTMTVSNSPCTAATATYTINVSTTPPAPAGIGGSTCGTGPVNLSASDGAGTTIDWYAAPSGGIALATGTTNFTTPSLSATTIYYAETRNTNTSCISATRTAVTATFNSIPTAAFVPLTQDVCFNSSGSIGATGTGGASVTISYSIDGVNTVTQTKTLNPSGTNLNGGNFSVGPITANTTVTLVSVSLGGCTATLNTTALIKLESINPTITAPAAVNTTTNTACTATGVALGTPVTADNCSVASVTNNAPAAFPLGNTTVIWTVTDGSGNTATANQVVTVTDNINPTITAPAAVNATTNTACTATGVALGTPVTADNCSVASVTNNAPTAFPLGNTTVIWTVTDGSGNTTTATQIVTVTNPAPIINSVTPSSVSPVQLGQSVTLNVAYTDNNVTNATITWDDLTTSSITNPANPFIISKTYSTPGVYAVTVKLTDACGLTTSYIYQYFVIYDPNGGFVTGGGWINSPAGAYVAYPSLTGKANFGFVAKYKKGSTSIVDGETEFQFQAGNLKFNSSAYENMSLVIGGAKASYKGTGTINGSGSYKFMLTAIDGDITNGGGLDKIRMKITDLAGTTTIYDNLVGGGGDNLDPTTVIGGGSIVIHTAKAAREINAPILITPAITSIAAVTALEAKVMPNPTTTVFNLVIKGKATEPVTVRVTDVYGNLVQLNQKIGSSATLRLGERWTNGTYFVEVIQGNERKLLKVIKAN
ncbi:hypothetical protein BH11BAC5_BH11BAC5_20270 [soil metagenome]